MKELNQLLTEAGEAARYAPTPQVDVRSRVRESILALDVTVKVDTAPLYCSAALVALAASLCLAFSSSWQTLFDPWASYFSM